MESSASERVMRGEAQQRNDPETLTDELEQAGEYVPIPELKPWVLDKACSLSVGMDSHADGTALGETRKCKQTGSLAAWWQGRGLTRENGSSL